MAAFGTFAAPQLLAFVFAPNPAPDPAPVLNSTLDLNSTLATILNSTLPSAHNSSLVPDLNSTLATAHNSSLATSLNSTLAPFLNSTLPSARNSSVTPTHNSSLAPDLNSTLTSVHNSSLATSPIYAFVLEHSFKITGVGTVLLVYAIFESYKTYKVICQNLHLLILCCPLL